MVLIRNPIVIIMLSLMVLPAALYADQFRVIRVIDGDTITVITNGNEITVSLVGIDAPELPKEKHLRGQPFSLKAKEHLAELLLNKVVTLKQYGTDRSGRSLAEAFVDGVNINLEMVKAGLAEVYRGKSVQGLDMAEYRKAERDAREQAIGIWVLRDQYFSPRDWREMYGLED